MSRLFSLSGGTQLLLCPMWPSSLLKRFFPWPNHIPHTRALSSTWLDTQMGTTVNLKILATPCSQALCPVKSSLPHSLASHRNLDEANSSGSHWVPPPDPHGAWVHSLTTKLRGLWACVVCFLLPGDLCPILL